MVCVQLIKEGNEKSITERIVTRLKIDNDGASLQVLTRWTHASERDVRKIADELARDGVLVKVPGKSGTRYALKSVASRVAAGAGRGRESVELLLVYAEDCIRRARSEVKAEDELHGV